MQELKRDPNILLLGLGGTGKSFEINKIISNKEKNNEIQTNEICCLTFDKALSTKNKIDFAWSNERNSFTIHGFCYHVLHDLSMLPEGFQNNSNGNIKKGPTGSDFNKLISQFLGLTEQKIKRTKFYYDYIRNIKIITCDEVQDFREDYLEVVKKIKALSDEAQLIVAGDRHQQIYIFQNRNNSSKLSDVLNNPKLIFDNEKYERRILTENHRTNNHYLDYFMNGFLKINYKSSDEELYVLPNSFNNSEIKQSRKMPLIKLFTNKQEEADFVKKEVSKINRVKSSIAIIARNKKALITYEDLNKLNGVKVSTVHKVKGNGFDYVFFVGFEFNLESDPEIKTICYTAISRAKKKLFITSSFPNKNIFEVFKKGSFEYRNVQRSISKSFPIRKKIKQNKEVSLNKIQGTYLDSLDLKVKAEKAPFLPYIKKEGTKQGDWTSTQRFKNEDGLEYSIKFHHSHKIYYFEFLDLDILKRNNFSDIQKIEYCTNVVIDFFDRRIRIEDIILYRLDLFNLYQLEDEESYFRMSEKLFCKCLESKHRSILTQEKKSYKTIADFNIKRFSKGKESIYLNHHKTKYNNLTTAIYNPKYKENENKIPFDNLIKFEMRGKGDFLSRNIGFNGKDPNARNLHNLCKEEEGLKSLLESWREGFYDGDLKEFDSLLIENQ